MTDSTSSEISDDLKKALRGVASTVTVITAASGGRRSGLTATSVCSVSMEPPQMLVCVNRDGVTHEVIVESGQFCINILGADQEAVSNEFAKSNGADDSDPFKAQGDWDLKSGSAPVLRDGIAAIHCDVADAIEAGTHSIFVGRVREVTTREGKGPLLYFDQGYSGVGR